MNAYENAVNLFRSERDLLALLRLCLNKGVVICDSEVLLGCIPCFVGENNDIEIQYKKQLDKQNGWYVCICSGSIKKSMSLLRPSEFVVYERFDGRNRIVPWRKLWGLTQLV